ncbi:MAG: lipopolysaccharide biosynthesis protein, partial [Arcobacter sp.]|nr:lipopolysaccharide biosynthesis protein [Arcobacter sp.]
IISAILARLLTPKEYGTVAIILIFTSFFGLLSSIGIGPAIVQNKSLSKSDIKSIFTFTLFFGIILSIIFYLFSPVIASYYENEVLINLARLMSLTIIFQSLQIVPMALSRKNLRFKQIGIISVVVEIVSGIITIILAYKGFSFYALVIRSILSSFLIFIFLYAIEPIKISFRIKIVPIKKIAKFSTFQFLFNFINYFSRNADNLLIGKFFSMEALGFYDKSYRLMMMPVQNLTHVITPVLHPVLSEYHNDKKTIYEAYYKIVRLLAIIGFPLSIFLYYSASEIISIMYGAQWLESIPVFKLLSLTIGIQIVLSSTGSIFQATNRTDLMFYSGFLSAILTLSGIGYGVFVGKSLEAVGFGIVIAFSLNFFQGLFLLVKIALQFSFFKFLKVLIFPFSISLSIAFGLWLLSFLKIDSLWSALLLKIITTVLVFGIGVLSSKEHRELFNEYIIKKFRSKD